MLKLSKLADYATVLMTVMAEDPSRLYNGVELSERTHVPHPTVAKLLKTMARGGLLESLRGAHGGYRLARAPGDITIADVIRALEGPIAVTECAQHGSGCGIQSTCQNRENWTLINTAIRRALEAVNLAQMRSPLNSGVRRRAEIPVTFIASRPAARSA